MARLLQPFPTAAGDGALALLRALPAALNGQGPALLPHPAGTPAHPALGPGSALAAGEDEEQDPTAVVLATSGSTGAPKGALLPASALLASASATHDRLGGPGHWLLAMPAVHVAGVQVLVRSLVAGVDPVCLDLSAGFQEEAFGRAAGRLRGPRRYAALVPTQLVRLLETGGDALAALAGLDAVLIGGAATPPALRERAERAGVRLVTTYGMSETSGGCVYDGRPLDGVRVRLEQGRIVLGGSTVARGHRGLGRFPLDRDGTRWFATDDLGEWDGEQLFVHGRADDVIVTGGLKVAPTVVEACLAELAGVGEVVVVGVPDEQWGARVVAAVVPAPQRPAPTLADLREHVRARLGAEAAPRQLVLLDGLPLRGPGKPDRAALRDLAVRG